MNTRQSLPAEEPPEPSNVQEISLPARTERLHLRLESPAGTRVRVEVEAVTVDGRVTARQSMILSANAAWQPTISTGWRTLVSADLSTLSRWLTWLAMAVYLALRVIALPSFPIYFFTDEAIQTVSAADLLFNGLHSGGEFLPTYFANGTQYNLSLSVYLQVLPYLYFDKSVWATRGICALVTLLAAWSVGRILRDVFHSPYSWVGVLALSLTPAWFLHSRTAFETALATSLYAVFLYAYLLYRTRTPRALYASVLIGALAFYAYSAMRVVMAVTALLLLLSDLGYHMQQRRVVLRGLGFALLLALPFVRFLITHPEAGTWQMRLLGSVWVSEQTIWQKLSVTLAEYARGLNPLYWYLPHNLDLARHTMPGYGHLLRQFLPFGLAGVVLALRRLRDPAYRVLLISIVAAPAGAALVRLGVTRALVIVIPMAVLTALAIAALLEWLRRRWPAGGVPLALAVFLVLSMGNIAMLADALGNGPLWFRDYGLNGMQYGARQLFGEIAADLSAAPGTHFVVTPTWTNGTDVVARFFFDDPLPFELASPEGYYRTGKQIPPETVFVMTPQEWEALPASRFAEIAVIKTLPYPDGQAGFRFVRLAYVENIQAVIEQEQAELRQPIQESIWLDGQQVALSHTRLDIGEPAMLFDGNLDTLIRTQALNPLVLDFQFPSTRSDSALVLHIGGTETRVEWTAWQGDTEVLALAQSFAETTAPRSVQLELQPGLRYDRLRLVIYNANEIPEGHVHLWEIAFEK